MPRYTGAGAKPKSGDAVATWNQRGTTTAGCLPGLASDRMGNGLGFNPPSPRRTHANHHVRHPAAPSSLPSSSLGGSLPGGSLTRGFIPRGFIPSGFISRGFISGWFISGGLYPAGLYPLDINPLGIDLAGLYPEGLYTAGLCPAGLCPAAPTLNCGRAALRHAQSVYDGTAP